ncbi:rhodanese-like domain-containing protein [Crocinitomicaceae bacterium]|nr:rhodanese-like domain-containing protein [Crocinitomicaceae bacterium]
MRITKIFGLFLMSTLFLSCSNAQEEVSSNKNSSEPIVSLVDKSDFKKLMEKEGAQLLDVRTPREVANGKIGEAIEMNFHDSDFKSQLASLDKEKPVLVYCAAGGRSAKAVQMMKTMGFIEIHELRGGYSAWVN